MSWKHALLGVLLLLTACSANADPHSPPPVPTPAGSPPPYELTRHRALAALPSDDPPRGFTVRLTCRGGEREPCRREGAERARWLVGAVATGAPLPEGNGLRERVTAIVMAWPSPAQARRYVWTIQRQLDRYRGEFHIPVTMTGPRRYTPGDRGKGEVQRVSLEGWRGTGVRRRFFHYFDDYETSGTVYGGRFVMRRGPYVADVEWVARGQATDRRLSHLPARLLRALP